MGWPYAILPLKNKVSIDVSNLLDWVKLGKPLWVLTIHKISQPDHDINSGVTIPYSASHKIGEVSVVYDVKGID